MCSGMIPGYVAGHYSFHQCHIDLVKLCTFADVALVHAAANHVDTAAQKVCFPNRPAISYDCLSIDIGITPRVAVPGFEYITPVKPIDRCATLLHCIITVYHGAQFVIGCMQLPIAGNQPSEQTTAPARQQV